MSSAQLQDWNNLGQIAATASATLVGLLFVAVSLNRDRIFTYPWLRARAIQTLLIFMLPLLASILLAIPDQSTQLLGVEFLVLTALYGVGLGIVGRTRTKHGDRTHLERLLSFTSPDLFTTLLMLICSACLIAGQASAVYWFVGSVIPALIGGVTNAWIFLVGNPQPKPVSGGLDRPASDSNIAEDRSNS